MDSMASRPREMGCRSGYLLPRQPITICGEKYSRQTSEDCHERIQQQQQLDGWRHCSMDGQFVSDIPPYDSFGLLFKIMCF